MNVGAFSISLAVKDLDKSRAFYEKIGFKQFAGNPDHNYLIMKNGEHLIGLFQGMFDKNILTFNPGWNQSAENLPSFTDIRVLYKELRNMGVATEGELDETTSGPASFFIRDPDGNQILFDQHR